jgi:hypothetical protein
MPRFKLIYDNLLLFFQTIHQGAHDQAMVAFLTKKFQ